MKFLMNLIFHPRLYTRQVIKKKGPVGLTKKEGSITFLSLRVRTQILRAEAGV